MLAKMALPQGSSVVLAGVLIALQMRDHICIEKKLEREMGEEEKDVGRKRRRGGAKGLGKQKGKGRRGKTGEEVFGPRKTPDAP